MFTCIICLSSLPITYTNVLDEMHERIIARQMAIKTFQGRIKNESLNWADGRSTHTSNSEQTVWWNGKSSRSDVKSLIKRDAPDSGYLNTTCDNCEIEGHVLMYSRSPQVAVMLTLKPNPKSLTAEYCYDLRTYFFISPNGSPNMLDPAQRKGLRWTIGDASMTVLDIKKNAMGQIVEETRYRKEYNLTQTTWYIYLNGEPYLSRIDSSRKEKEGDLYESSVLYEDYQPASNKLFYPKFMTSRGHRNGELFLSSASQFDDVNYDVEIPAEVFSLHSMNVSEGKRVLVTSKPGMEFEVRNGQIVPAQVENPIAKYAEQVKGNIPPPIAATSARRFNWWYILGSVAFLALAVVFLRRAMRR